MRVSIRHIAGHLVWTAHGTVWAIYRLHPGPGGDGRSAESVQGAYLPAQVRDELIAKAAHLVRSLALAGSPRLYGLCAQVDAGEVALKMLEGADATAAPAKASGMHPWAEVADAALDLLADQEMHQRTLWLAVPLVAERGSMQRSATAGALWAELSASLGVKPAAVTRRDVAAYRQLAEQVEQQLTGSVSFRPATPAEVVWMVQHALCRGLDEPLLSQAAASPLYGGQVRGEYLQSPSYADLGQVRLLEGGTDGQRAQDEDQDVVEDGRVPGARGRRPERGRRGRDSAGPWWRRGDSSPLVRRWLQVETEQGVGYQAHLALAECPPAVSVESADLFAQLESLEFPVDFCVDLTIVSADKARRHVQRKKTELVDQSDQYAARPTGMPASLLSAARDLGDLDARLARTSVEVEVQSVTTLCVWGPDPAVCDGRARALASVLAMADYRAVRPAGMQESLFTLGLPATPRPPAVREFVQHQVSEDWAMLAPLTLSECGDPDGMLLGVDLDCGTTRPVLLNIADAPKADASASLAVVADPGAGKSVLQKLVTQAVVDRGGRAICIDRTPLREWATFARSAAPGRCQVIDAAAAGLSIDPLRMFPGRAQGTHYALSYLTLQLGIGPMTVAGGVLHRAVELAALRARPSMQQVIVELEDMAASADGTRRDAAATLVDLLRIVASNQLASMVFDPALEPVQLGDDARADLIVITTAGLTLPPREAMANPGVLKQQPLEALIGRAVLYLIAAISRQTAFEDVSRFCAIAMDELWWLSSSSEGEALISEVLHDGRKHFAGLIAGAQDALELGKDRGLFAYRACGRTSDRERARRALQFVGQNPDDPEMLRLVTTGLSPVGHRGREGEMLLTAPRMNTSRIKVLIPEVQRLKDGVTTTPGQRPHPVPAVPDAAVTPAGRQTAGAS
ncbi:ATP-binding protein [Streptomyces sp. NPDC048448]|uniref:ATP-binding protein n=1 Tax=unclassified Streptomyces TaxID=2593676 RepID=UPI0034481FAD